MLPTLCGLGVYSFGDSSTYPPPPPLLSVDVELSTMAIRRNLCGLFCILLVRVTHISIGETEYLITVVCAVLRLVNQAVACE